MAQTKTARRREMAQAQEQGKLAHDRSIVVHTFEDGWTIRRLSTCSDVRREGVLMRSCLPKYVGDEQVSDKPLRYEPSVHRDEKAIVDATGAPAAWREQIKADLDLDHCGLSLYSLRDETNLPHATFWSRPGHHTVGVFGYRNGYKAGGKQIDVKPHYLARVREWAHMVDAPVLTDEQRLRLRAQRSPAGIMMYDRFERNLERYCGPNWRSHPNAPKHLRLFEDVMLPAFEHMLEVQLDTLVSMRDIASEAAKIQSMIDAWDQADTADLPEDPERWYQAMQDILPELMEMLDEDLAIYTRLDQTMIEYIDRMIRVMHRKRMTRRWRTKRRIGRGAMGSSGIRPMEPFAPFSLID